MPFLHRSFRWPAYAALLASIVAHITLPERLNFGPNWLIPAVEVAVLVPLLVIEVRDQRREAQTEHIISLILMGLQSKVASHPGGDGVVDHGRHSGGPRYFPVRIETAVSGGWR